MKTLAAPAIGTYCPLLVLASRRYLTTHISNQLIFAFGAKEIASAIALYFLASLTRVETGSDSDSHPRIVRFSCPRHNELAPEQVSRGSLAFHERVNNERTAYREVVSYKIESFNGTVSGTEILRLGFCCSLKLWTPRVLTYEWTKNRGQVTHIDHLFPRHSSENVKWLNSIAPFLKEILDNSPEYQAEKRKFCTHQQKSDARRVNCAMV